MTQSSTSATKTKEVVQREQLDTAADSFPRTLRIRLGDDNTTLGADEYSLLRCPACDFEYTRLLGSTFHPHSESPELYVMMSCENHHSFTFRMVTQQGITRADVVDVRATDGQESV